jgi:hypothetical protein
MSRYSPIEPKLMAGRHRARVLAHKFNTLDPGTASFDVHSETQHKVLTEMLGKVGAGTFVEPPFRPDYGCNTVIGKNCFFNFK